MNSSSARHPLEEEGNGYGDAEVDSAKAGGEYKFEIRKGA
jgi:hypothetical protein